MITTTACTVSPTGISAPSFADILDFLKAQYFGIFGSDIDIDPDTQDGQLIAIFAAAVNDSNAATISTYNAFSPATAQKNGLSSVVKINGIMRDVPSFSEVDIDVVGVAGTILLNCVVKDAASNNWSLPDTVTIPIGGAITVTAICQTLGAVIAPPGTVNQIATPTLGWQTATNSSSATPGAPVESDAALRQRQTISTAIPSLTVLDGIIGAVASVPGVDRYRGYENDTNITDGNGIPAHTISLVVEGGDAIAIANAIMAKKTPGTGTFGTTSETVTDVYGIAHIIKFYRPTLSAVTVAIALTALSGYTSNIGVEIQNAVAAYITGLGIGQKVMLTRVYLPANLNGTADSLFYEITAITLNGSPADVAIAFNGAASCVPSAVVLTVT